MGNAQAFQAIEYELESSVANWAEAVTTFATHRLPAIGYVDMSGLVENKEVAGHVEQYRGAGQVPVLMDQEGSFEIVLDLVGHGATTAGSPSADAIETFLSWVIGNGAFSLATSQTATGGTAAVPTTSGANGVTAGGIVFVGALGDGRGNGQGYPVATHAANALTLLAALMKGAPSNGDVIFPAWVFYPPSAPTTTNITGARFQVLTANMQYRLHGCFPQAIIFRQIGPKGRPQIAIRIGVSRWSETASGTFPSTVTSNKYNPGPVANGSLHVSTVGVSTRNDLICRDFNIEISLGIEAQRGPGGVGARQTIVGAKRLNGDTSISFTVDADDTTANPVLPGWGRDELSRCVAYTLNTTVGKRVMFFFPKVCSNTVPVQMGDGGVNRFRFSGIAYTGDTLTTDLTRSRWRMGWA